MTWYTPIAIFVPVFLAICIGGVVGILKFTKDKTRRASTLRLFVQCIAVAAVFMGLLLGPFDQARWAPLGPSPRDRLLGAELLGTQFPDGISVPILACYYANGRTVTCPIWQLQAYVFPFWNFSRGYDVFYSLQGLEMIAIVLALVIAMSLIVGRFFCGWICPLGLYQDLLSRLRKGARGRHLSFSDKTNTMLGQARWIIIAVFMILSVIFASYAIFGTELIPGTRPGGPLGTEAGIVGIVNEPFCLVCPARPLCVIAESAVGSIKWSYVTAETVGASNLANAPFWTVGFYVTSINIAVLIVVTILALAYRRFWCRICPLGGLTALFSTFTPFKQIALMKLQKTETTCTKCGVCKRVCPTQVTAMYEQKGGDVTVSGCMLCYRCVEMCPEKDTLKIEFAGKPVFKSRNWLETDSENTS